MIVLPHNMSFSEDGLLNVELGVIRGYIPKSDTKALVRVKTKNGLFWCEAVIGKMTNYLDKLVKCSQYHCIPEDDEDSDGSQHEQVDGDLDTMNTSAEGICEQVAT